VIHSLLGLLLLAQADQTAPNPWGMLMPLVIIMLLGYFMLWMPQKRRERETREMLQGVKENDRVVTIGGIHGVVTNVQRDAERVTIRVDESNGTKLKLSLSAIARIVTGDEAESGGSSNKSK
jgi:preprotein translocase subunit YajC